MLHELMVASRDQIIARASECVGELLLERSSFACSKYGIVGFVDRVSDLLSVVDSVDTLGSHRSQRSLAALDCDAGLFGQESLKNGLSLRELVNSYGAIRRAVTELAGEASASLDSREFHLFNTCLDGAIASAVTAYGVQQQQEINYRGTEQLGVLAHEMRNLLNTMTLAFGIIREGKVGFAGSTGAMLSRSISSLTALVDRSTTEVRLVTSAPALAPISVASFMQEMQINAAVHAQGYGLQLTVHPVDRELAVDADWQLMESAVSNLVENACKFTRPKGQVSLVTRVDAGRVLIDVCDECGGLPTGSPESLFRPFSRVGPNRSGLGLGLFVARNAARASRGDIRVRNIPGTGCVFTVDLAQSESPVLPQ